MLRYLQVKPGLTVYAALTSGCAAIAAGDADASA